MTLILGLLLAGAGDGAPLLYGEPRAPWAQEAPPAERPQGLSRVASDPAEFAVETHVVWTHFHNSLYLENGWGAGAEGVWTLTAPARFGFRLGATGWDGEIDEDNRRNIPEDDVRIWKFRAGLGVTVPMGDAVELGFWLNGGVMSFERTNTPEREHHRDTGYFWEHMVTGGFRLADNVTLGFVATAATTRTNFNHKHRHWYGDLSIGPTFEVRF